MAMRYNRLTVLAGAMLALGLMTCLSGKCAFPPNKFIGLSNSMVFDIESLNHSINHGINHVPEFCKKKMVLVPKFLKTVLHLKLNVQLFNKDTYSSFIHWIRILTFAVYSCFFFPFQSR